MKKLVMVVALATTSLLAKEPDLEALAGTWHGEVDGDKALVILKADGTALVKPPEADENVRVRGTWKLAKPGVVLELTGLNDPNEKITVRFLFDEGELVLVNVTEPNGKLKTYAPPRFKQTKVGDKKFTGEYKGLYEEEPMRVVVMDGGKVQVWPDAPNVFEPLHRGTWMVADGLVVCKVQADGGNAGFYLRPDGKDYLLVQVEKPDGEVKEFKAPRFKRVKKAAAPKPLNPAAKKLTGKYVGVVENKKALLELRADGTAAAWPQTENRDRGLRGTWLLQEGRITAKLKREGETQSGTLLLTVDGTELILKKVISPDGDSKDHNVRFRRQK